MLVVHGELRRVDGALQAVRAGRVDLQRGLRERMVLGGFQAAFLLP